ncbi:MAG: tetratricopeptide repeat protein, partial [Myxococcales bacterium]|nr:tetratricopeptide repeat protein [Myxococcales bacterium]
KLVRQDLAADQLFRKLFDLEVRISARFTHPHIVPLHDHGELEDGTPWLGLALADAGSFKTLNKQGPRDWAQIQRLVIELLDALSHLHARGVVHRDVKPENILLYTGDDGEPHVWLADLGLANASLHLARRRGRREGTPGYMSPEQSMGLPREYGPATDIYAVGAVLWELVTGDIPFDAQLTSATADLPTLVPRANLLVPAALPRLLKNCLDAEPLSRYDLAADLRTEILALGEPEKGRGDFDAPEEGVGTIALGAKSLRGASSVVLEAIREGANSSPGLDPYVPFWNRPIPPGIPEHPPVESGRGASARASLKLFALREPPLIARTRSRQALWDQARAVRDDGRTRVVLVTGAAGSGKTRLVESVVRALEEGGWAESCTLNYQDPRGVEDGFFGAARALLRPWKESRASLLSRLRRRLARERGSLDPSVKEEANLLTRWCGFDEPGVEEEPVPEGMGLREVYRHLDARGWRGLSVMVLENAHHGREDGDGLALAEAQVRGNTSDALLIVATLRTEELEARPDLRERVEALVQGGAVRIDIDPLNREETLELIEESLALAPDLSVLAAERCEGNPLFARQLLLEWSNREWLVPSGDRYRLQDGVDASEVLPTDATALLRSRLDGLAEASGNARRFRDTMHMAAMAGVAVPRDLVEGMAGDDLANFVLGCDLWVEREDRMRFHSSLLHQAMRALAEERRDASYLHRRLGRAFARYGEQSGRDVNLDIGRHAMVGRDFQLAIDALMASCKASWRRRNSNELKESGALAIEAAYRSPAISDRTGWANIWKARAHELRGEPVDATAHFNAALVHCEGTGDDLGIAAATIGLGWASLQMGRLDEADAYYNRAFGLAETLEPMWPAIEVVKGRAWLEQQKRNFDGAEILFTRAANWSRKSGDIRGKGEALLGQAFVALRRGEFDEADEIYEEAAEAFQEGDDLLGIARAWVGKGVVRRQRSQFDEAMALFTRAVGVGEELGATEIVMESRYRMAEVHRRRGETDQAALLYNEHLRWASLNKKTEAAILAELGLAMVALLRDDMHDLYDRTTAVSRHLEPMPAHWLWATYRLVVAAMLAHRADENGTYTWLWSASELGIADIVDEDIAYLLTDITAIGLRSDWRNVVRVAGRLAIAQLRRLGDPEGARFVKQQVDRLVLDH